MKKIIEVKKVVIIIIVTFLCMFSTIIKANDNINVDIKKDIKIENSGGEIEIEKDVSVFSKKIIESDFKNGEINIELTLKNIWKTKDEEIDLEVFFVMDNSGSMTSNVNNKTRKQVVIDSSESLTKNLFDKFPKVKIGGYAFSDKTNLKLISSLTNDKDTFLQALTNYRNVAIGGGTDVNSGITAAMNAYSKDCKNKVMIILTDGVPNADVGGGYASTKKLLQNEDIYIISLISSTNVSEENKVITEVFGTKTNPTADEFYNVLDTDIEKSLTENIYKDIVNKIEKNLKQIIIKDFFPQEMLDYFIFEYVEKPNLGIVSDSINIEDKSITWNIDELKEGEIAKLIYKLKFKDKEEYNLLLNHPIKTNEKISVEYMNGEKIKVENELINPEITITEERIEKINKQEENIVVPEENSIVVEEKTVENIVVSQVEDNTIIDKKIPYAGNRNIIFFIIVFIGVFFISTLQINKNKF